MGCAVTLAALRYESMFVMALNTLNLSVLTRCMRPLLVFGLMTCTAHVPSGVLLIEIDLKRLVGRMTTLACINCLALCVGIMAIQTGWDDAVAVMACVASLFSVCRGELLQLDLFIAMTVAT